MPIISDPEVMRKRFRGRLLAGKGGGFSGYRQPSWRIPPLPPGVRKSVFTSQKKKKIIIVIIIIVIYP